MGKAICILGQKGGAGKTTTVVNLAAALALSGKRTLIVDVDPQGIAKAMVSILSRRSFFKLQDVIMHGVPVERAIVQGCLQHLKLLPAPLSASLNDYLRQIRSGSGLLKNALAPIKDDFEYILMDAQTPEWSYIAHAAAASDYLLFNLRADYLTFSQLGQSLDTVKMIKTRFNPELKFVGIILTLYDPKDEMCVWILRKALHHCPKWLFRTIIPKDPAIAASALAEKPVVVSDYDGKSARSFRFLANEFIERIN